MNEFYGSQLTISESVKYVGEGEDPIANLYFIAYINALKEVYQPERLNPEDHIGESTNMICDSLNSMET